MNETICRLCLQTISNDNWQAIEESLMKTLKLNPNISKKTVMCVECANCLPVFSKFAPRFVHKGDRTLPLSDLENGTKLDPARSGATSKLESLMATEVKCSFCTEAYGREDVVSLNDPKENKFMVNTLEQYISKMNLNSTEKLIACGACLEALEGVLGIILKCLEVEEKISGYIELKGTDDKGQIELKEVQKLMLRPKVKLEIDSVGVDDLEGSCDQIKEENTMLAELEMKYETEISHPELIIKTDVDIKSEQSDCDLTDIKSGKSACDGLQEPFVDNKIPDDLSLIPVVTSEIRECYIRIKQHRLTNKISSKTKIFHCVICSYETKNKNYFWNKHLLTHNNTSEPKMFKCELCLYEATQEVNLKRHLLIHNSTSELKMFKCELCPYKAKTKSRLKSHLLIHKSPSDLKMFKCILCSYESNCKGNLKRHLLTHKSPSELNMFKCGYCSYETKHKGHLKMHLLSHKSPS